MTMISGDMGRLPRAGAFTGWMRAVAAKFTRRARLKNTSRAEFEQVARDLDLSSPQLYGLLTGRALSADAVEKRLSDMESVSARAGTRRAPQEPQESQEKSREKPQEQRLTAEMREFLMFGPFCC